MARRPPLLTVLAVVGALLVLPAAAAAAEPPRVGPPSSPAAIAACGQRAAEHAKTAHVEREVRGIGTLGGCIADQSGIAHLFLDWETADGDERGRICVDPKVRRGAWSCTWATLQLEPGSYVVTMVAIDAAGNRGTVEQAYRVLPPAEPTAVPEPQPKEPVDPIEPVEPAVEPVEPVAPVPPIGPTDAVDPTDPTDPAEPAPAEPLPVTPPVSLPVAQLVADRVEECGRLELAPGVVADRALSIAVLECMRPALEAAGATDLSLDEIPVPPSIRVALADAEQLAAADELLPDAIGGVGLELVLGREPT